MTGTDEIRQAIQRSLKEIRPLEAEGLYDDLLVAMTLKALVDLFGEENLGEVGIRERDSLRDKYFDRRPGPVSPQYDELYEKINEFLY